MQDIKSNVVRKRAANEENLVDVPQNVGAERALLGSIIHDNTHAEAVMEFLLPEHFFIPLHQKLYKVLDHFINNRNHKVTVDIIKNYLADNEQLEKAETDIESYLLKLKAEGALVTNPREIGRAIYDEAMRRNLIDLGNDIINAAYEHTLDSTPEDQIEEAERRLFQLSSHGRLGQNLVLLRNVFLEVQKKVHDIISSKKKITGITTGFMDLDKYLGGLQDSDLLILAARPSMGKTALAVNIALNAAGSFHDEFIRAKSSGKPKSVGVFSLEMSSEQLTSRAISIVSGIDGAKLRMGINKDNFVTKSEFDKIASSANILMNLPFYVDDTPALTISALRTRARRMKRQHNLGLLIIDYLQLVRSDRRNDAGRVQEVGDVTQGLKEIAKELNVPVLALSQLSRAVESREDKRPMLSDLRESGSIEQDADAVMFIYRPEYYLERKRPANPSKEEEAVYQAALAEVKNIAEIIIAKQRNGPVGNLSLQFDNRTTRFADLQNSSRLSNFD
jgi:replicative DNA helicase